MRRAPKPARALFGAGIAQARLEQGGNDLLRLRIEVVEVIALRRLRLGLLVAGHLGNARHRGRGGLRVGRFLLDRFGLQVGERDLHENRLAGVERRLFLQEAEHLG